MGWKGRHAACVNWNACLAASHQKNDLTPWARPSIGRGASGPVSTLLLTTQSLTDFPVLADRCISGVAVPAAAPQGGVIIAVEGVRAHRKNKCHNRFSRSSTEFAIDSLNCTIHTLIPTPSKVHRPSHYRQMIMGLTVWLPSICLTASSISSCLKNFTSLSSGNRPARYSSTSL
ncbi:hypothetical protein CALVIDRAFT_540656 [Calocera viscosa TUFC12733]|uniref:Uncharacterized protein n=1 Tax=Calocera viscosa (strain TUFC12733) TaxID=1330018 RepID=A0A167ILZ5_CALVF|nr:hypothetical protein CALVIDRAFT_540656 [Calocera viscosa TUFC12733]